VAAVGASRIVGSRWVKQRESRRNADTDRGDGVPLCIWVQNIAAGHLTFEGHQERSATMSNQDSLTEPVQKLFHDVWNRKQLQLINQVFAADVVLHSGRNAVVGVDAVASIIGDFLSGFPDVQHKIEDTIAEHDRVVARWRGVGTHLGPYADIAPTGRRIDYTGITIFRIADGLIAEAWVNAEMAELLASLREP
jgi:predicted ester cyclase